MPQGNPLGDLLPALNATSTAAVPPQDTAPPDVISDTVANQGIVVQAPDIDPDRLFNSPDIVARDEALQAGSEDSQHRGMFGLKGTLRDVLGLAGDAFLLQAGRNPMYMPKRRQERLSDAMAGFTQDPQSAIERIAGVNPALAQEMNQQYNAQTLSQGRLDNNVRNTDLTAARDRNGVIGGMRGRAAGALYEAMRSGNPEILAQTMQSIEESAARAGVGLDELGLSRDMTPEQMQVFIGGDAGVNKLMTEEAKAQQRIDANNRAAANRNAANARAGQALEERRERNQGNGNSGNSGGSTVGTPPSSRAVIVGDQTWNVRDVTNN